MIKTVFISIVLSFLMVPVALGMTQEKIHPWLLERLGTGKQMEFLLVMKDSADLSQAELLKGKREKGRFVHDSLRNTAEQSQAPIRAWLKARGVEYSAFTIVNALLVKGDRALMESLARRDDIARIEGNPEIRNILPQPEAIRLTPASPDVVEWNISQVRAPEMWALGITGSGIVVGGQDTGYRWTHDALKSKYRGWNGSTADHNYNWHDAVHSGGGACGADAAAPCDDYGHGTHTMGTVLGDDGGANQTGVAPGAKWIGCRNMNQGVGTPTTYLECFEFFLAPYPLGGTTAQGDSTKAPDLTVNSWSCTSSEGCSALTLETAVNNMKAAGIMTIVSAGNSGPSCGSVATPPAIYGSAYTVGSTTSAYAISNSSSRGPASFTGLVKPDIMAPGNGVRSAASGSDSAYTTMSGTSMAAPHVAGAVALLWSSSPNYRHDQDATQSLLNSSAMKLTSIVEGCGGDYVNGPNNSWGNGLLDLVAAHAAADAVKLTVTLQGTGSGIVTSDPAGFMCSTGTCNALFDSDSGIKLVATPGTISTFGGWSGVCSGIGNCTLTMTENKTVNAAFDPAPKAKNARTGIEYTALQTAYSEAQPGDILWLLEDLFANDWTIGKSLSLKGGYNGAFSGQVGYTTLQGVLVMQSGSVVVERFIVK
jgi:serine protease AprX